MLDPDALSSYDYQLPPELIAAHPLPERDASRLLVLNRHTGQIEHHGFRDFPTLLRPHDLLVLNETKVIPARLIGHRTATGGHWEGLFLGTTERGEWRLIGQTRGKLQPGESLTLRAADATAEKDAALQLTLVSRNDDGEWTARVEDGGVRNFPDPFALLDRFGTVPLPPYIQREQPTANDRERYQTTFARTPGAIAAPTAGLHFTPELLDHCRQRGVSIATVALHVGIGTFRPVNAEQLSDHVMHHEWYDLPQETVDAVATTRLAGGRVIAIGTTTVRTLEAAAQKGPLAANSGTTDLFIRPPYEFQVVDALLTNFHLPRSTLLVLLSAFAGHGHVMSAYQAAIEERYRFYSYGDAMFVHQG